MFAAKLVFCLCMLAYSVRPDCKPVISELNSDNPPKHDTAEFIEIEFICAPGEIASALGYRLIFMKGLGRGKKPEITFYAALTEFQSSDDRQFYVVGSEKITKKTPNLVFNSPRVRSTQKNIQAGQRTLFDIIPNAARYPEAVILLYGRGKIGIDLDKKIVFTAQHNYFTVTDDLIEQIKPFITDMLVYSRKPQFSVCSIFEILRPEFKGTNYILQDFDSPSVFKDFSINRCTDRSDSFIPSVFKTGPPTPGEPNDCSGSRFIIQSFIAESYPYSPLKIPQVAPVEESTEQHMRNVEFDSEQEHYCSIARITEQEVYEMHGSEIEQQIEKAGTSGEFWALPEESSQAEVNVMSRTAEASAIIVDIDSEPVKKKMKTALETMREEDWNTEKYFDPKWKTFITSKLSQ